MGDGPNQPEFESPADYSDVFISYSHSDRTEATLLADALRAIGLTVWISASEVEKFESIQVSVERGLSNSRVLLAYYSKAYPTRRACQWELTAAYIAAQNDGDPRRRILAINPEEELSHIFPYDLRDESMFRVNSETFDQRLPMICRAVKERVKRVTRAFGDVRKLSPSRWWGDHSSIGGSTRFVGRLEEMWGIHSILFGDQMPLVLGGAPLGQLRGLGGIGKSLLAEEYARRFGAAFPGGIFWLRGHGNDDSKLRMSSEERDAERLRQYRSFLDSMGVAVGSAKADSLPRLLAQEIERREQLCLWIADDVPSGLTKEELDKWMAPTQLARCLLTTRSREYSAIAQYIDLEVLSIGDSLNLLTHHLGSLSARERLEAESLVADLGFHALAIDVAGNALASSKGLLSIAQFRKQLASPSKDALELASRLSHVLPNGHQTSIVETLLCGVRQAGPEAQDFLRLASALAVAPIKPSFARAVFARADRIEDDDAAQRLQIAFRELDRLSLVDCVAGTEGARTVHTLVSRVMRQVDSRDGSHWLEGSGKRREKLRKAALKQIVSDLKEAHDSGAVTRHLELALHHASDLATRPTELPELDLLVGLAGFELERGAHRSAHSLFQRALVVCRMRYGTASALAFDIEFAIIAVYINWGAADVAEERTQKVLTKYADLGERDVRAIMLRHALAQCYRVQQKLKQAREEHQKVIKLMATTQFSAADLAGVRQDLAETLLSLGEFEEAEKIQRVVLEDNRRNFGGRHPVTLLGMNNLAVIVGQRNNRTEEERLLTDALAIREEVSGIEHPQTSVVAANLVVCLKELKRDAEAEIVKSRYLVYLIDRDPETLGYDQHKIRVYLLTGVFGKAESALHASGQVKRLLSLPSIDLHQDEADRTVKGFVREGLLNPRGLMSVWRMVYAQPGELVESLIHRSGFTIGRFGMKAVGWTLAVATCAEALAGGLRASAWFPSHRWPAFLVAACGLIPLVGTVIVTATTLLKKRNGWGVLMFWPLLALVQRLGIPNWTLAEAVVGGIAYGILGGVLCGGHRIAASARGVSIALIVGAAGVPLLGQSVSHFAMVAIAAGWLIGFLRLYYLPVHLLFVPICWPTPLNHLHPIFWDGLIRFPLFGLRRFLVTLSRRNPQEGDEAIQNIMDGYPSQGRFALAARLALALEQWG